MANNDGLDEIERESKKERQEKRQRHPCHCGFPLITLNCCVVCCILKLFGGKKNLLI